MYPIRYQPQFDFTARAINGATATEIAQEAAVEFANVADTINQINLFLRNITNADMTLKSSAFQAVTLLESEPFTATAGQTVFVFVTLTDVDPSIHTARVHVNGALVDPTLVTLTATDVTIPATVVGDLVLVDINSSKTSIFLQLADTAATMGASLIAIEDAAGKYFSKNVEDALIEVRDVLDQFITEVGSLTQYHLADGTVVATGDWDLGGKRITNLGDGVDPKDAVNLSQLLALTSQLSNLDDRFLTRAGGNRQMGDIVDMNDNPITGIQSSAEATAAMRRDEIELLESALRTAALLRDGSQAPTADLPFGGNKATGLADATDPQDAVTLNQVGDLVDTAVAASPGPGWGGSAVLGSLPPITGECVCDPVTITQRGVYDFGTLVFSVATSIPSGCVIRVQGDLTISDVLTIDAPVSSYGGRVVSSVVGSHDAGFGVGAASNISAIDRGLEQRGSERDEVGAIAQAPGGGNGVGGRGGPGRSDSTDSTFDGMETPTARRYHNAWQFAGVLAGGTGGRKGGTGAAAASAPAGGGVTFFVDGDVIMTGGTINASGGDGGGSPGGAEAFPAGSGGGSVKIYCLGTFTDGLINTNGGSGTGDQVGDPETKTDVGGGGGGHIVAMANTFAGEQNFNATGGNATGISHGTRGEGGIIDVILATDANNTRNLDAAKGTTGGTRNEFVRNEGVTTTRILDVTLFTRAVFTTRPDTVCS